MTFTTEDEENTVRSQSMKATKAAPTPLPLELAVLRALCVLCGEVFFVAVLR
jgi:hypothetical protein